MQTKLNQKGATVLLPAALRNADWFSRCFRGETCNW